VREKGERERKGMRESKKSNVCVCVCVCVVCVCSSLRERAKESRKRNKIYFLNLSLVFKGNKFCRIFFFFFVNTFSAFSCFLQPYVCEREYVCKCVCMRER